MLFGFIYIYGSQGPKDNLHVMKPTITNLKSVPEMTHRIQLILSSTEPLKIRIHVTAVIILTFNQNASFY